MTEFREGQKVRVSFEGAVVDPESRWYDQCVKVYSTGSLNYSYVHPDELQKVLPYTDGKEYVDADGEILTFTATGRSGGPGWRQGGTGYVSSEGYARRPLRPVGEEIQE